MQLVRLGQITAPVGIKGEVRVFPYTDRESRFSDVHKVYIGEDHKEYTIGAHRRDKNMVVIAFSEISDRNSAEALRGQYIFADKNVYRLEKDVYFTDELTGCRVFSEDGDFLGELNEIIQSTAQDIYSVKKDDGKCFLVPAVKEFIRSIDTENKKIIIHIIEGLI